MSAAALLFTSLFIFPVLSLVEAIDNMVFKPSMAKQEEILGEEGLEVCTRTSALLLRCPCLCPLAMDQTMPTKRSTPAATDPFEIPLYVHCTTDAACLVFKIADQTTTSAPAAALHISQRGILVSSNLDSSRAGRRRGHGHPGRPCFPPPSRAVYQRIHIQGSVHARVARQAAERLRG